jgi:twitching motility two-component system response regulator PilH
MLERANFAADAVPDGSDAWDALQTDKYDLVVSDCDMPRLSGIDLLKRMRITGMMEPVILMSGSLKNLSAVNPASFGPLEIVAKPFSFYHLIVTVDALLPFAKVSARQLAAARPVFNT